MSDKFCFKIELCESPKTVMFSSATGEEYYVSYTAIKFSDIELVMEWMFHTENLVKVELFTTNFVAITSQMQIGNDNVLSFKFNVDTKQLDADERNLISVITIIPYVKTTDSPSSPCGKIDSLTVADKNIENISEDILIGFAMDIRELLVHGSDFSDAVITNGNRTIKVHAAILSARSPVFRSILKDPTLEKVITISDASAGALDDMIQFVYSSFIKFKDLDRAEELYELARQYKLEDLHEVCSIYMSNCTIDRVLKTLILADKHQDDQLKNAAIAFILENLGELKSSEEWKNFAENNESLVSELYSSISGSSEKNALRGFMKRISAKKSEGIK